MQNDLYELGDEAEVFVYEYIKKNISNNVNIQRVKTPDKGSSLYEEDRHNNCLNGDIIIGYNNSIRTIGLDVKRSNRGFISYDSITNFMGDYYCFVIGELEPENIYLVDLHVVGSYSKSCPASVGPSGKQGFYLFKGGVENFRSKMNIYEFLEKVNSFKS